MDLDEFWTLIERVRHVVADERGVRLRMDPHPDDLEWRRLDRAALPQRYPRLWALFGEHQTT